MVTSAVRLRPPHGERGSREQQLCVGAAGCGCILLDGREEASFRAGVGAERRASVRKQNMEDYNSEL